MYLVQIIVKKGNATKIMAHARRAAKIAGPDGIVMNRVHQTVNNVIRSVTHARSDSTAIDANKTVVSNVKRRVNYKHATKAMESVYKVVNMDTGDNYVI